MSTITIRSSNTYLFLIILTISNISIASSWNYTNKGNDWDDTCKIGPQAPLDIAKPFTYRETDLKFYYTDMMSPYTFNHNGNNLVLRGSFGHITFNSEKYYANQLMFYSPSLHSFNNTHLPLEMQIIHRNSKSQLVTICILFKQSETESSQLLSRLHFDEKMMRVLLTYRPIEIKEGIDLSMYVQDSQSFFLYDTYETTPPCTSQNVMIILSDLFIVGKNQMNNFPLMIRENIRMTQSRGKRKIFVNFEQGKLKQLIKDNHQILDMNRQMKMMNMSKLLQDITTVQLTKNITEIYEQYKELREKLTKNKTDNFQIENLEKILMDHQYLPYLNEIQMINYHSTSFIQQESSNNKNESIDEVHGKRLEKMLDNAEERLEEARKRELEQRKRLEEYLKNARIRIIGLEQSFTHKETEKEEKPIYNESRDVRHKITLTDEITLYDSTIKTSNDDLASQIKLETTRLEDLIRQEKENILKAEEDNEFKKKQEKLEREKEVLFEREKEQQIAKEETERISIMEAELERLINERKEEEKKYVMQLEEYKRTIREQMTKEEVFPTNNYKIAPSNEYEVNLTAELEPFELNEDEGIEDNRETIESETTIDKENLAYVKYTKQTNEDNGNIEIVVQSNDQAFLKEKVNEIPLKDSINTNKTLDIPLVECIPPVNETIPISKIPQASTEEINNKTNDQTEIKEESQKLYLKQTESDSISNKRSNLRSKKQQSSLTSYNADYIILNMIKIFFNQLKAKYTSIDNAERKFTPHYPYLTKEGNIKLSFKSLSSIMKYIYGIISINSIQTINQAKLLDEFKMEIINKQNKFYASKYYEPILLSNVTTKHIDDIIHLIKTYSNPSIQTYRIKEILVYVINESPISLIDPIYNYNNTKYAIEFDDDIDYTAIAYERSIIDSKYDRKDLFKGIQIGQGRQAQMTDGTIDPSPLYNINDWPLSCKANPFQSPINIGKPYLVEELKLNFDFRTFDENETIIISKDAYKMIITGDFGSFQHGSHYYNIESIEIHTPSEHTFDDDELRADMEMQLIAKDIYNHSAAIAVLFKVGNSTSSFLNEIGVRSQSKGNYSMKEEQFHRFSLGSLIKNNPHYVSYTGSMTTPPCIGNVKWFILMEDKYVMSQEQLNMIKKLSGLEVNIRGIQPLNGRVLKAI